MFSATSSVYFFLWQLSVRHNKINCSHTVLPTFMMALPLRVLRYKSVMQSETRNLRAIWSRVKSGTGSPWATWSAQSWRLFWTGSQAQRGGALGERQWRSTVDRSARRELLERIDYWERIKSVWKRLWVPESSHVTGMCNSCTLIVLSIRASILFIVPLSRFHSHVTGMCNSCTLIVLSIRASILFIVPLSRFHSHVTGMCNSCIYAHCALNRCFYPFNCTCHYRAFTTLRGLICAHPTSTLRCHWDCGAHDSFQGVVPMLSIIASQCMHVTISHPLDLFYPVTLFSSERRPAALVLNRGPALKVAYGDPLPPLTRSQRPYCAFPHASVLFRSQWERHRDRG